MTYSIRRYTADNQSQCLFRMVQRNNTTLIRKIIFLGGDVNTCLHPNLLECGLSTPLSLASYYGHNSMVHLLLKAGASQFPGDIRMPLIWAIRRGHETTARLLSAGVNESDCFYLPECLGSKKRNFLDMICRAGFVKLTQTVLECGDQKGRDKGRLRMRSIALYSLLSKYACRGEFIEREIQGAVHEITELLLEHGADPDFELPVRKTRLMSTRELGLRNPDP